VATC